MLDLPNPPTDFNVEKTLSEELLKLSFKERQAIQEEIHGVSCGATEETSELLEKSLLAFDEKINTCKELAEARPEEDDRNLRKFLRNICRNKEKKNSCYLNSRDIRLRFLRCECFNVEKAVERFICFLEFCSELFGDYICEREMVLSDLNAQEMTAFRSSRSQYLPFRDRSGRRIMVSVGNNNFHLPMLMIYKLFMFQHWQCSKDVETQRKGIVIALWPFDENEGNEKTWEKVIRPGINKDAGNYKKRNDAAMPLRVASFQMYYKDTPFFHTLSACFVFYALTPATRAIYRAHFGNHTELCYQFGSYGISPDLLPISVTGKVKFGHMNAWINYCRGSEAHAKYGGERDLELVECPWINDVIFRKGSTFRNNPGNVFYRSLIVMYSDEHSRSDKTKKVEITHRIVDAIEKRNCRFLEWSPQKSLWIVMNDRTSARKKIASAFKQYGRKRKSVKRGSDRLKGDTNYRYKKSRGLGDGCFNKGKSIKGYSLKDYYSLQHIGDDSCFGKCFHLTQC